MGDMLDVSKWDWTTWLIVGAIGYVAYCKLTEKPVVVVTPPTAS